MKSASLIRRISITALLALLAIGSATGATGAPKTRVRFINGVPGLTKVDMRLNDNVISSQVPYSVVSTYQSVNAGDYSMDVTTLRAQTTVVPPAFTDLEDVDEDYTLLCFGSISGNPKIDVVNLEWERMQFLPKTETSVVVVHSCPDSGPVDVFIDGSLQEAGAPLSDFVGPTSFTPGMHTVDIQIGGNSIASGSFRMQSGKTNTILFTGTMNPNDGYPILLKNFVSR